ncbi:Fe-S cluster assembly ATPase SufC [Francisella tularensis]|uniref:ABC transporter, ATP-binding protein n=2 Tax=Francisella tularensis subsp. holarctica TaxID=119857 RepID=A0ABF7PSX0_FRATH|nr:Fe-S cluster assembly ATPase SufC [Francisella tularensis]EBA52776.1 ABC transporter, ATP-binding protein [Francisella tularensis subsp. holarctica 257]ABI83065.1 ABC superfamily ATP binding cassette transporter, ABC protein [Francisella tularensis subsp. holarctica OSU18]ABU61776.1 FeS assembly ATPase SufC [Francisella tularensis subsp. holarctica FTNF002-00]AFT92967.1 sufS activator complex, sufC subunit [Francisella tularensis subsp. holarctica FSC200]AKO68536.1 cysteine desulfurase [Fra
MLLEIKDLHVSVGEQKKQILKGLNLTVKKGEVHAIMGPNGAGKSTLSNVLAGKDGYEITQGSITFDGKDLNDLSISERAAAGIFLSLQYPIEIPGVSNVQFLKTALNSIRKQNGEDEIDAISFMKKLKENMQVLKIDQKYMSRGVNEGFSGGEKKRNEMLQLMMLEPKLAILDETDSGLDIDALQVVSQGANSMRSADRSFLVITHYQRLLDHIQPDFVHVLADGKIVKIGGKELALELEEKGYSWLNS